MTAVTAAFTNKTEKTKVAENYMEKSKIDDKALLEKRVSTSSVSLLLDIFAQILKRKLSNTTAKLPSDIKEADNSIDSDS